MTFYIEGRTTHELMTTNKLFKKRQVDKTEEIDLHTKQVRKKQTRLKIIMSNWQNIHISK